MSVTGYREILTQRLKLDVEFYEFAKQRLFSQWNRVQQLQQGTIV